MVSAEVPNKEIAAKLSISEASVRVYKAEVFEKNADRDHSPEPRTGLKKPVKNVFFSNH